MEGIKTIVCRQMIFPDEDFEASLVKRGLMTEADVTPPFRYRKKNGSPVRIKNFHRIDLDDYKNFSMEV